MTRRNSFARRRGGAGGKSAPPDLSVPFADLDNRSQAERDADFSPIRFFVGLIAGLILFTFFFKLACAIKLVTWE